MKALLDTHAFLWAIDQPSLLSQAARDAIEDPANKLCLSVASLWEIALKRQAGKLELAATEEFFRAHMGQLGITEVLAVQPRHVYALLKLPPLHKDPFDRLLVTQCQAEGLVIVTRDRSIAQYGVTTVW